MLRKKINRRAACRGIIGQIFHRLRPKSQPEPEPIFVLNELRYERRFFGDRSALLGPRLAWVNVQAVSEMQRWLVLDDHTGKRCRREIRTPMKWRNFL